MVFKILKVFKHRLFFFLFRIADSGCKRKKNRVCFGNVALKFEEGFSFEALIGGWYLEMCFTNSCDHALKYLVFTIVTVLIIFRYGHDAFFDSLHLLDTEI